MNDNEKQYTEPGGRKKPLIKTLGFILFGICTVSFLLIVLVPFLKMKTGPRAAFIGGLFVIGEVSFYTSVAILGKAYWTQVKNRLKKWFRKEGHAS